jgi:hypothetical protein
VEVSVRMLSAGILPSVVSNITERKRTEAVTDRNGRELASLHVLPQQIQPLLGAVPEHRVGECIHGLPVRDGRPVYSIDIHIDPRCS